MRLQMTRRIMGRAVLAIGLALLATVTAGAAPVGPSFDGADGPAVVELGVLGRARDWLASLWTVATGDAEPEPTDDGGVGSGTPLSGSAGDAGGFGDHGAVVDPDG